MPSRSAAPRPKRRRTSSSNLRSGLFFVGELQEGLERRRLDLQERFDSAKEEAYEFEQVGEALRLAAQIGVARRPGDPMRLGRRLIEPGDDRVELTLLAHAHRATKPGPRFWFGEIVLTPIARQVHAPGQ